MGCDASLLPAPRRPATGRPRTLRPLSRRRLGRGLEWGPRRAPAPCSLTAAEHYHSLARGALTTQGQPVCAPTVVASAAASLRMETCGQAPSPKPPLAIRDGRGSLPFLFSPLPSASRGTDSQEDWVPYAQREEWRDIVPVEQDDGPDPVVAIAYSPQCASGSRADVAPCLPACTPHWAARSAPAARLPRTRRRHDELLPSRVDGRRAQRARPAADQGRNQV